MIVTQRLTVFFLCVFSRLYVGVRLRPYAWRTDEAPPMQWCHQARLNETACRGGASPSEEPRPAWRPAGRISSRFPWSHSPEQQRNHQTQLGTVLTRKHMLILVTDLTSAVCLCEAHALKCKTGCSHRHITYRYVIPVLSVIRTEMKCLRKHMKSARTKHAPALMVLLWSVSILL